MKKFGSFSSSSGSRPLKVGEEIRHALAEVFMRGEAHDPELDNASITVAEVRVSPDLKNATAYVMPLAGDNKEAIMQALKRMAPHLRAEVAKRVKLRYMPRIHYRLDESYEEAARINAILNRADVSKDIKKGEE